MRLNEILTSAIVLENSRSDELKLPDFRQGSQPLGDCVITLLPAAAPAAAEV